MSETVKLGSGLVYEDLNDFVIPAFDGDQDAINWRDLEGREFESMTIVLKEKKSISRHDAF